jgi:FkbM family methyltransferase
MRGAGSAAARRWVRSLLGPDVYHLLRLARRWLRSLRGADVFQPRQHRAPRLHLGEPPGARWCVYPGGLSRESVVYSFGIGRDLSFERALIERFGLTVHAFDPTPPAVEWVSTQRLPAGLFVHPVGLADYDGSARFAPPGRPDRCSFSMLTASPSGEAVEAPVRRLITLMAELGHPRLDLLKMDIEGAEYRVLADVLRSSIRPGQILVEFHHRWRQIGPRATREAIRLLNGRATGQSTSPQRGASSPSSIDTGRGEPAVEGREVVNSRQLAARPARQPATRAEGGNQDPAMGPAPGARLRARERATSCPGGASPRRRALTGTGPRAVYRVPCRMSPSPTAQTSVPDPPQIPRSGTVVPLVCGFQAKPS